MRPEPLQEARTGRAGELIASDAEAEAGFATVDLYRRREKIFTRHVRGFYQRLRLYTGWPLLIGYFALPWINWGDRQSVLFDLPARQFHILGLTFWPQDFMLLAWLLIIAAFALFTVTNLVGRLWCGYTCPQTVWTAIFMWMEQVAEGSRNQRMRLDRAAWSWEKIRKRGLKHGMWLTWAFFTGLTFVGYFVPIRTLIADVASLQVSLAPGVWIGFFTVATYVNAGWLREQVCIYMCPYARFQSAMFDADTLIVSYDPGRGEPRGPRRRGAESDPALGDCVDCLLCVQVCPTGIDIRDGLQYECIGCAHCIDACDEIMDKMSYPRGLVRYTTEHALAGRRTRILRPRAIGYAAAFVLMCTAFVIALVNRVPLGLDVIRDRGQLYTVARDGSVRNDYTLKIMNMDPHPRAVRLTHSLTPAQLEGQRDIELEGGEIATLSVSLFVREGQRLAPISTFEFQVCRTDADLCASEESRFFTPASP
jgi:cytochrome c oxidase accessory protein FixG